MIENLNRTRNFDSTTKMVGLKRKCAIRLRLPLINQESHSRPQTSSSSLANVCDNLLLIHVNASFAFEEAS